MLGWTESSEMFLLLGSANMPAPWQCKHSNLLAECECTRLGTPIGATLVGKIVGSMFRAWTDALHSMGTANGCILVVTLGIHWLQILGVTLSAMLDVTLGATIGVK